MKRFRTKLLVLCGLVIMAAATVSPVIVRATCPDARVSCTKKVNVCHGHSDGQGHCVYSEDCLDCGVGDEEEELLELV
jgi:hypothetical protein